MHDFASKIQKLSEQFHKDLGNIRVQLKEAYLDYRERPDKQKLTQLIKIVHRLSGSGATFGFPAISQAALSLERMLDKIEEQSNKGSLGESHPNNITLSDIREGYENLQNSLILAKSITPVQKKEIEAREFLRLLLISDRSKVRTQVLEHLSFLFNEHKSRPLIQTADSVSQALTVVDQAVFEAVIICHSPDSSQDDLKKLIKHTALNENLGLLNSVRPIILIEDSSTRTFRFNDKLELASIGLTNLIGFPIQRRQLEDALSPLLHSPETSNYRVMLIDDDVDLLNYYQVGFQSMGLSLRVISQPSRVSEEIAEFKPELLIIDVHLDGMSGFDLAKTIGLSPEENSIPIVFMSTDASVQSHKTSHLKDLGFFLLKPLTAKELLNSILPYLRASRRRIDQIDSYENSLRETERASERASEDRNQMARFLATMTHEIRNPLNGILGMTRLLARSHLSESQFELVSLLDRAGQSLLSIANNVLDHSKLESGKIALEREWCLLSDLKHDLESLFSSSAKEKRNFLIFDWNLPPCEEYFCDRNRILQVLVNLTSNSVKFTREGIVVVHASATYTDKTARVAFKIIDSGPGISLALQSKIFNPFEQGFSGSDKKEGTGLGLVISSQLANLMDTTIQVDSNTGAGSIFQFNLNLSYRNQTDSHPPEDASEWSEFTFSIDHSFNSVEQKILREHLLPLNSLERSVDMSRAGMESPKKLDRIMISRLSVIAPSSEHWQTLRLDPQDGPLERNKFLIQFFSEGNNSSRIGKNRNQDLVGPPDKTQRNDNGIPFRVLVAEDDTINQVYIRSLIEHLGYECTLVSDGLAAVEKTRNEAFDLVILDFRMPIMTGPEAASLIRQFNRDVPIIALTADSDWEQKTICLRAGIDHVLTKPLVETSLSEWLNQLNPRSKLQDQSITGQFTEGALDEVHVKELMKIQSHTGNSLFESLLRLWPTMLDDFWRVCNEGSEIPSFSTIQAAAHRLKGASGNLGAIALQRACERLESAAKKQQQHEIRNIIAEIRQIEKNVKRLLDEFHAAERKSG